MAHPEGKKLMRHRFLTALGLAAVLAAAPVGAALAQTGSSGGSTHDDAVVATDKGPVRGTVAAGHRTFEGIPYAAPPVGALRWTPPRPASAWTTTRAATRRGNDCPQVAGLLGDRPSETEDCLYLNVTTPRRTKGRVPVLFFVHGGGFYSGSAALYRAERLAEKGDVLVVTANYRLGVFGFLAHPSLDGQVGGQSGDYGLQDQQAALRWVQRNATSFGGDPDNVTLVGESAGSVSTCSQLAAPSSAGLFDRAIMESGPCAVTTEWPYQDGGNWYPRSRAVAENEGTAAAKTLGCTDPATAATCLRGKTTAALLTVSGGGQGFGPVYGGGFLPVSPSQAVATGRFNQVPVMHGTTRDEHRLFVYGVEYFTGHTTTAKGYRADLRATFGPDRAAAVLARYPLRDYASPSLALAAVWTDYSWSCPALSTDRSFSKTVPTYAFEFADTKAPWSASAPPATFPLGAFHAAELQYLFNDEQFPGPATAAQRQLSDEMIGYWTRFAHTGDPNGPGTPEWQRFRGPAGHVQSLAPSGGIRPVDLGREHRCEFWQGL
jgi:para-nitrobenzyl esterase